MSAKGPAALERGKRKRPYPHTMRRLAEALGLTDAERAELIAAVPPRAGASPPPAAAEPARAAPHGLPGYLDPLIGREREATAVRLLLRPIARRAPGCVTLTGPGGVGKTRLALQVAGNAGDQFPDGVGLRPAGAAARPGARASARSRRRSACASRRSRRLLDGLAATGRQATAAPARQLRAPDGGRAAASPSCWRPARAWRCW